VKTLTLAIVFFLPMGAALWHYGALVRPVKELPDEGPSADEPGVLDSDDLVDKPGTAPFRGKVIRLNDLELKVIEEDYVKYYVRLGRLARAEGKPRLEDVFCAFFDPPENGRPKLRVTIESPFVEGDPASLLHESRDAPRVASLGGGVVVRDPQGRELARVPRLELDLTGKTARSADAVRLRFPGRGELNATGLFVDLDKNTARLDRDVRAQVTFDGDTAKFGCDGPATLEYKDDGKHITATLTRGAWFEHPLLSARCARIVAELERVGEDELRAQSIVLSGGVDVTVDPAHGRGIESVHVPTLEINLRTEHEERIVFVGELVAIRKGPVEALGLGDREIEIRAGGGELTLQLAADGKREPRELRFTGGFEAKDRHGAGYLRAGAITYTHATRVLEAKGKVEGKTTDGLLKTDLLRLTEKGKSEYDVLLIEGQNRIEYVADGKLGPLGADRRGRLVLECKGPIVVKARDTTHSFHARDTVRASLGEGARMECGDLVVVVRGRELQSVEAKGGFDLLDEERDVRMRGKTLVYKDKSGVLEGNALVAMEGRTVTAGRLAYSEDGAFEAAGRVSIRAPLAKGRGVWEFSCDRAAGVMRESDEIPESLEVTGNLVALGPEGQRIEGDSLSFDGKTGKAALAGAPAIVSRGDGMRVEADQGFDLVIKGKELADASSRGPARVLFVVPEEDTGTVRRWSLRLRGPASFKGSKVTIPSGATLKGFDKDDKLLIEGTVNRVELKLERQKDGSWVPASFVGDKGVRIVGHGKKSATVTARTVTYEVGTKRVNLRGSARVVAEGWSPEVTFEHVVFTLEADGVDLKRASRISIRDRNKR